MEIRIHVNVGNKCILPAPSSCLRSPGPPLSRCRISILKKQHMRGLLLQSLLRQGPVSNDEFSIPFMEQCTLDAIGVLIISPTAGGGGLGRLRCNVDSEGGKYTSATPRCTCFPPRATSTQVRLVQVQVHLGFASEYLLSSSCNFNSSPPRPSPSSPRLRLGELGLGLGGLERSQWVGTSCNFSSSPPRQVQVHLGCASVNLALSGNLSEVLQVHIPPL